MRRLRSTIAGVGVMIAVIGAGGVTIDDEWRDERRGQSKMYDTNELSTQSSARMASGVTVLSALATAALLFSMTATGCEQVEDEPAAHNPGEMSSPVREYRGGSGSTAGRARDAAKGAIGEIEQRQKELGDQAGDIFD